MDTTAPVSATTGAPAVPGAAELDRAAAEVGRLEELADALDRRLSAPAGVQRDGVAGVHRDGVAGERRT